MSKGFADIQRGLNDLGYGPLTVDGIPGPKSLAAYLECYNMGGAPKLVRPAPAVPTSGHLVRIIMHWTAGPHDVSDHDRDVYHYIVSGGAAVIPGKKLPESNISTADGEYVAHTLNCNTGSIGIAMAAMLDAIERPFSPGPAPILADQLEAFIRLAARLCVQYGIAVTPHTVLTHAEVQPTLGIPQKGKWDIAWLPGMAKPLDPVSVGGILRGKIAAAMNKAT